VIRKIALVCAFVAIGLVATACNQENKPKTDSDVKAFQGGPMPKDVQEKLQKSIQSAGRPTNLKPDKVAPPTH
jgi:hypothetical protein